MKHVPAGLKTFSKLVKKWSFLRFLQKIPQKRGLKFHAKMEIRPDSLCFIKTKTFFTKNGNGAKSG